VGRQLHDLKQPVHGTVLDGDAASGALHDLVCDRPAQSRTIDILRPRTAGAEERLENLPIISGGIPGPSSSMTTCATIQPPSTGMDSIGRSRELRDTTTSRGAPRVASASRSHDVMSASISPPDNGAVLHRRQRVQGQPRSR
jgi:hypothetical protein